LQKFSDYRAKLQESQKLFSGLIQASPSKKIINIIKEIRIFHFLKVIFVSGTHCIFLTTAKANLLKDTEKAGKSFQSFADF